MDDRQETLDRFYFGRGKCCAGCDWWRSLNAISGECTATVPVSSADRVAMLGVHGLSLNVGAGHVLTSRDHVCGGFADTFDWSTLPPHYRRRVGDPNAPKR